MKTALNNPIRCAASQRGVGLIEVLIALVIFALGVVGMAGLQIRTVSLTMDSTQRSYVVAKAQDIADRVRSNGIPASNYLNTYNQNGDYCDTPPVKFCADNIDNANATACTMDEMYAFDLYDAFCGNDENSLDSLDNQVTEWQAEITCEYPEAGVMTPTTACDEFGATVNIDISWFARTVATDVDDADRERDFMNLRFVP